MKTKPFQTLLKVWITIASLAAFLSGWIFLGHSGKPVDVNAAASSSTSTSQVSPLPTLAPLPSFNSRGLQPLQQSPSTSFAQPRFRTRGS